MNTPAWQDRLKWRWSWRLEARILPASELSLNQNNSQFSRTTILSYSQGYQENCSCTYKEIDFQLICMVARSCGKHTLFTAETDEKSTIVGMQNVNSVFIWKMNTNHIHWWTSNNCMNRSHSWRYFGQDNFEIGWPNIMNISPIN